MKTEHSCVGDGTKIVLTGDINQIDTPYLDPTSNGLSYLIERFKGQPISGHLTLQKTERSTMASLATEILQITKSRGQRSDACRKLRAFLTD